MENTATYSITDLGGRIVAQGLLESGRIPVSELSNGTYILLLEGAQTQIQKIQIQH
jgi:hypothetical protein